MLVLRFCAFRLFGSATLRGMLRVLEGLAEFVLQNGGLCLVAVAHFNRICAWIWTFGLSLFGLWPGGCPRVVRSRSSGALSIVGSVRAALELLHALPRF